MSRRGNPRSTRRRGARAAIGAFAAAGTIGGAFGLSPLAPAPPAHADADLDWLVELFAPAAGLAAGSDPLEASDVFGLDLYTVLHDQMQTWITSPLGIQIDTTINQLAGAYLIGNGIDGTADNPNGGAGGLWFGDGGDGYDQTLAAVTTGLRRAVGLHEAGAAGTTRAAV
ncbi:hypothetical protein BST28_16755, partial [Mycolicibacter kumamotonensis]